MTEAELDRIAFLQNIQPGDMVWWSDPAETDDDQMSSGHYIIESIQHEKGERTEWDTVVSLRGVDEKGEPTGSTVEAYFGECC